MEYKQLQFHSAGVLHSKWFKSLGTFRKASRLTVRMAATSFSDFLLGVKHLPVLCSDWFVSGCLRLLLFADVVYS